MKYPIDYNLEAVKTLIRRAMEKGYTKASTCLWPTATTAAIRSWKWTSAPSAASRNLTKIDRMNGYLSYSRVHGDTRLNDAKMAEIAERKSM